MSKNFDRREYNKQYYHLKTKQKRQESKQQPETGQLALFDSAEFDSVKTRRKITLQRPEFDIVKQPNLQESDSVKPHPTLNNPKPNADDFKNVKQSNEVDTVKQFDNVNVLQFCQTMSNSSVNVSNMADQLSQSIQSMAFAKLFPSNKRSFNFWALAELVGLVILSGGLLFFAAQAVAIVDQKLLPLVVLLELVTMFFSLTLAKWSGFSFASRATLLLVCVGLTNFLVSKATLSLGQSEIARGEARAEQSRLLKSEVVRQQALIADLQVRGRITVAREESKRLDALMSKLEATGVSVVTDRTMVWVQVIVRVILGLSILLINHQISDIFVKKKFFKIG